MRGNPYVENRSLAAPVAPVADSDLQRILKRFQIDPSRFAADLIASLDKLPAGPAPSPISRRTSRP